MFPDPAAPLFTPPPEPPSLIPVPSAPPPVDVIVENIELLPADCPGGADPPPPTVIGKDVAVTVIGVDPFKGDTE